MICVIFHLRHILYRENLKANVGWGNKVTILRSPRFKLSLHLYKIKSKNKTQLHVNIKDFLIDIRKLLFFNVFKRDFIIVIAIFLR